LALQYVEEVNIPRRNRPGSPARPPSDLAASGRSAMVSCVIAALLLLLSAVDSVPAVRAHADLGGYFHVNDYPAAAALRAEVGTVAFTLDVDASGRVAACRVTASSGSQALDDATCHILSTRAQFSPARDGSGRAIPDRISDRVTWTLPEPPTGAQARANLASYIQDGDYPALAMRRGEQGLVGFELDVAPDGRVANCRVIQSSGSRLLDATTCQIMIDRARFTPARNADGSPAPDTVSSHVRWWLPHR
jgi:TonB family protein